MGQSTSKRDAKGQGKNRQKLALSFASWSPQRLTETAGEPYIGPLGCAAASARWRVREAPHCLHGDRASGHAHGHVRVTASNARGLCCLTSESEERETWTAESLRAAFRASEPCAQTARKRLRRSTFQVNTWSLRALHLGEVSPKVTGGTSSNVVISREKFSSNLRV